MNTNSRAQSVFPSIGPRQNQSQVETDVFEQYNWVDPQLLSNEPITYNLRSTIYFKVVQVLSNEITTLTGYDSWLPSLKGTTPEDFEQASKWAATLAGTIGNYAKAIESRINYGKQAASLTHQVQSGNIQLSDIVFTATDGTEYTVQQRINWLTAPERQQENTPEVRQWIIKVRKIGSILKWFSLRSFDDVSLALCLSEQYDLGSIRKGLYMAQELEDRILKGETISGITHDNELADAFANN